MGLSCNSDIHLCFRAGFLKIDFVPSIDAASAAGHRCDEHRIAAPPHVGVSAITGTLSAIDRNRCPAFAGIRNLTLRLRFNLPQPGVSIVRAAPHSIRGGTLLFLRFAFSCALDSR
jgi:hypothetical protein